MAQPAAAKPEPASSTFSLELPARVVYSLLKAAVRIAAKTDLSLKQLVELTELAYFEEVRRRHPRDLKHTASELGLSLRSVVSMNQRLKKAFFSAETEMKPARQITAHLATQAMSTPELLTALPQVPSKQLRASLKFLDEQGWVNRRDGKWHLDARLRTFVGPELARRIDGVNHQMEIVAGSVAARFLDEKPSAVGRSWAFLANPEQLQQFIETTIKSLRHGAIELEESAAAQKDGQRYAVTIAFAPMEEPHEP